MPEGGVQCPVVTIPKVVNAGVFVVSLLSKCAGFLMCFRYLDSLLQVMHSVYISQGRGNVYKTGKQLAYNALEYC